MNIQDLRRKAELKLVGILRLRRCFAKRNIYFAQDDR